MENKKSSVPKLRFPGFTGAWEQRKFDEIFKSISDKGYPELPVISASQELGMVFRDSSGYDIKHNKKSEVGYKRVQSGDFVIHLRSFQGGFAASEIEGITSPAYTVIRFKVNNQDFYFWKYVFTSKKFIDSLVKVTYGIRDGRSISYTDFKNLKWLIPSKKEQQQIGAWFEKFDSLIALHQRKLEHLQEQKKGLLQKMFPKNGEVVPEVRFPGFTDAWEQRKLGEFIIEFHEKTTVNDQYPILTSSRKGIFLQTDYYSGNQIASKDNTGYNIVPFGYFTYRHMSDDNIFRFNINKIVDKGIVSTLYPVFTTNKYLDSRYLQIQLNHGNEFAKYALLQKQGGSRTYMYLSKLKKLVLTMPNSISEQKTISNFFDTLDNLIALHQRKLEHLELMKKGLLQQMFV